MRLVRGCCSLLYVLDSHSAQAGRLAGLGRRVSRQDEVLVTYLSNRHADISKYTIKGSQHHHKYIIETPYTSQ
jgi:hypothetical protein